MKSFLDTYNKLENVPTRQNIADIETHFRRRSALYRSLGFVPSHLKGKDIIEFGPGSGENSIFLASLCPRSYTLVDGTSSSIKSLERIRSLHYPAEAKADIFQADFFDFHSNETFEAVFCEGAIPTQAEPHRLLRHIASFVKPGGILVITTMDSVSFLSEAIRRLLARLYIGEAKLELSHVPQLLSFFENDLNQLQGMSRRREDWIIDQIIHPWNGPPFSISTALDVLKAEFSAQGTSPRFLTDWRWYKTIDKEDDGFAAALNNSYFCELHNFLDWRFVLPPAEVGQNTHLLSLADEVYETEFRMETGESPLTSKPTIDLLRKVLSECPHVHPVTCKGIQKAIDTLSSNQVANECDVGGWWGRGQQYISLIRFNT